MIKMKAMGKFGSLFLWILCVFSWILGRVKDEKSQLGITAICFFGTILCGETEFTALLMLWIDWGIQKIGWKYGWKYKGFSKFIKGKNFRHLFPFFKFYQILKAKSDERVWLLRSRQAFRHQDRQIWLM